MFDTNSERETQSRLVWNQPRADDKVLPSIGNEVLKVVVAQFLIDLKLPVVPKFSDRKKNQQNVGVTAWLSPLIPSEA